MYNVLYFSLSKVAYAKNLQKLLFRRPNVKTAFFSMERKSPPQKNGEIAHLKVTFFQKLKMFHWCAQVLIMLITFSCNIHNIMYFIKY